MNTRKKGSVFEGIAAKYLQQNNYEIVAKNWFCRYGEIDIVTRKLNVVGKELVFFEVKSCRDFLVNPIELIGYAKLAKLKRTISEFMQVNKIKSKWYLDALGIVVIGKTVKLRHYKNILFN